MGDLIIGSEFVRIMKLLGYLLAVVANQCGATLLKVGNTVTVIDPAILVEGAWRIYAVEESFTADNTKA
jgi:hypothetical protein